jgi:hypothetical protein
MVGFFASTHAIANCVALAFFSAATLCRASIRRSLRSRFSPVNRGKVRAEVAAVTRGVETAQQSARQHAVGGDADPKLGEHRENGGFGTAADERVFDLEIADRVHRPCAADGVRTHLRQADRRM